MDLFEALNILKEDSRRNYNSVTDEKKDYREGTRNIEINTATSDSVTSVPEDDVKGITLLSIEEAKKLPKSILAIDTWWWLRSPGNDVFPVAAAQVDRSGRIELDGTRVDGTFAVRPALKISNLSNLKIGDVVECLGMKWYYVGKGEDGDNLILSVEVIGEHCFNAVWEVWKDSVVNEFEGSDIQEYLNDWLEWKMERDN